MSDDAVQVVAYDVPMRDGVRLPVDVYRSTPERTPAILLRTPYDRRFLPHRLFELDPLALARGGFAVAIQDVRGRFAAEGTWEPLVPDAQDGADAVAWLRAQPWCDGRVVTAGNSYSGCVQFRLAQARPEGLLAVAPTVGGAFADVLRPGGALRLCAIDMFVGWAMLDALAGELPAAERAELEQLLDGSPLERFHAFLEPGSLAARMGEPVRRWLDPPQSDPYWTTVTAVPERPLPAIHTTGCYDSCASAAVAAHAVWSAAADEQCPQLLTLGPWEHQLYVTVAPVLGLDDPRVPGADFAHARQRAFFESVMRGEPGSGMAPVMSYVLGRNRWHEDTQWPPRGVRSVALSLVHAAEGGALAREATGPPAPCRYRYDPRDPVPTFGGAHAMWRVTGPFEQAAVEARADVLCFTSGAFDAELEIAGEPVAHLVVGSSAPATDFVVKLCAVLPDGRSIALVNGNWSGRLADLPAAADASLRRCSIRLGPIHVALAPGTRLRLQVTSSSYPDLYPNPNTGHDLRLGPPPSVAVAEQTVLAGAGASTLELPVLGALR